MNKKISALVISAALVFGVLGFFIGMKWSNRGRDNATLTAYKQGWACCVTSDSTVLRNNGLEFDYSIGKNYLNRFSSKKEAFFIGYKDAYFLMHKKTTEEVDEKYEKIGVGSSEIEKRIQKYYEYYYGGE